MRKVLTPLQGVRIWRNEGNKFVVFEAHYTADPTKRTEEYRNNMKSSMPISQYNQEFEIQWDSFVGKPVYPDFNKRVHAVIDDSLQAQIGLPLLIGVDWGLCYDDETEVLTENGWKLFKDVADNEKLATINRETHDIEYHYPRMRIAQKYTGEMVKYDGDSASFCVTPDHIIPVWYEKKEARRYYAKDIEKAPRHKYFKLTGKYKDQEDMPNPFGFDPILWASLLGAYLSEGSYHKDRIEIHQKKDKEWIRKIINKTGWNWKDVKHGFRFNSREIASYFKKYGTQEIRRIPEEIRNGSKSSMMAFIDNYTLGDGHIRTRKNGAIEHTIYTCSERMAADFQELALKVGWCSSIQKRKPSKSFFKKENRWIHSSCGYHVTFKKRTEWAELVKDNFSRIDYDGMIYCFQVPHNTLYVRKNGRPHWNGNTPSALIGQLQEDKLCLFDEIVEENMGAERFMDKLKQFLGLNYPEWHDLKKNIKMFVDPAGFFRKDTDEKTCASIAVRTGFEPIPGAITWEERRSSVEKWLIKMSRGEACFRVNANRCEKLVQGFEGGYRYPESSFELEPNKIKPIKDEFSHCFIGSTKIKTLFGYKPIKDLKIGEYVKTPFGFRKITSTMNSYDEIIEVVLSNGKSLFCTKNHPFVTNKGVVRADALQYGFSLIGENTICQKTHIKSLMVKNSTLDHTMDTIYIKQETINLFTCIDMFIVNVLEKLKKDSIFIILTEIKQIIQSKIWNALNLESTLVCMGENASSKILINSENKQIILGNLQRSGMDLKKEELGTQNMLLKILKKGSLKHEFVHIVEKNIKLKEVFIKKDFAHLIVNLILEGILELIILKEYVLDVVKSFLSINIQKSKTVLSVVAVKSLSTKETVYDLTIEKYNCFYAEEALVLNCQDALQYVCCGITRLKTGKKTNIPSANYSWGKKK